MPFFSLVVAADPGRGIGYQGGIPWKLRRDMQFFKKLTCAPDPTVVEQKYEFYPEAEQPAPDSTAPDKPEAPDDPQNKQNRAADRKAASKARNKHEREKYSDASGPKTESETPNAVIMGRRTWESLPQKFKPLPGRLNLVLTRRRAPGEERDVKEGDLRDAPGKNPSQDTSAGKNSALFCATLDEALSQAEEQHCPNTYVIGGAQIYAETIRHPGCKSLYVTALSEMFSCDTFFPEYEKDYRETRRSPVFQEEWIQFRFKVFERI